MVFLTFVHGKLSVLTAFGLSYIIQCHFVWGR